MSKILIVYTDKGQKTRNHFIEISANLFNKKGYAGTSISDILDTAGYSKGALYRTFSDKDELALEAFKYNLNLLKKYLQEAIDKESNSKDKVLAIIRFYRSIDTMKFIEGGCPVLNTAVEADDTNPTLNVLATNAFKELAQLIETNMLIGQETGDINRNVDAKPLSLFIIAGIEGSIAMLKSFRDFQIIKNNMNILEDFVLQQL